MSWISEYPLSWIHQICFAILKRGTIPKHIAIVMDGNRRFARKSRVKSYDGHQKGFEKLTETLQWCLNLEIYEVTVFAFSIENFNRSQEEIDDLMELAKEKFKSLINEWKKLEEHGICVRVIGNFTFLPREIQALIMIIILLTSRNTKACLNIAFSYTVKNKPSLWNQKSECHHNRDFNKKLWKEIAQELNATGKEELCSTSEEIMRGLADSHINEVALSEKFIDDCLYTFRSPDPDILIRTSGETRISNFLMWQCSNSYIHFANTLWPEFSVWNFCSAIFSYQQFHGLLGTCGNNEFYHSSSSSSSSKSGLLFSHQLHDKKFLSLIKSCLDVGVLPDVNVIKSYNAEQVYQYYNLHIAPAYLLT